MLKFNQIIANQDIQHNGLIPNPKVSIVLLRQPGFAVEHMRQCLDSIHQQTLTDYECIIVDCDVHEHSLHPRKDLTGSDPRFIWLGHAVNMDLSEACLLNEGILRARAPFTVLNPNATLWQPDALELLLATANLTTADVVYGNLELKSTDQPENRLKQLLVSSDTIDNINVILMGAVICRIQLFETYGLFDPHIMARRFYDWDLWRRSMKAGASFYHLDRAIGTCEVSNASLDRRGLDVYERAYLVDDQHLLRRSQALRPEAIASYDLVGAEKIVEVVRDTTEWDFVEEKYFKPYAAAHPEIEYTPIAKHNRLYDPTITGYSLNPPMAVSKPRKKVLFVADSIDCIVEDWKRALATEGNNIVLVCDIKNLEAFKPTEIDCLIIFNCFDEGAMETAEKFRDSGVSVIHLLYKSVATSNEHPDESLAEKWCRSTDQMLLIANQPYETMGHPKAIRAITVPRNGLESSEFNEFDSQILNWGVFIGNAHLTSPQLKKLAQLQDEKRPWTLFISQSNDGIFDSLPDHIRTFYTNDPLAILASNLKNFCLFVPDEVLSALTPYEQLLVEEEALRSSNVIVPFAHMHEISSPKQASAWFYKEFEKRKRESIGQHPKARALHIQNLVLSVEIRKKIAELRNQESASNVKALVMVNSQAIAGSETYGLLVTKGLFYLGMDVRFCTPARVNVYPQGLKTSQEWLEKRNLPGPIQADYGQAGYAMWYPDFPEEMVFLQSQKFRDWLERKEIGLVVCSAMIPEPFIAWRDNALAFMALFAPWEYNLDRLTLIGKTVDGLFSDSHWALTAWVEMNPSLNAYAPSMIEPEYFQILNGELPSLPIRIAIAGTIQPRKRQKEAVLAVRELIKKGHDVLLNIYGYQLDSFQTYTQEINEIASQPEMLGNVKLWGFVEDPHQIARDNHIILCASTDESVSQSVLFNQAAGLVPVSCPAGGIPEIVIDGKTGFLAEGFGAEHIADALERAIHKRSAWQQIIRQGRNLLLHECTEQKFMQRILKVMIAAAQIKTSKGAQLFHKNDIKPLHRVISITEVTYPSVRDLQIGRDLTHRAMLYSMESQYDGLKGFNFLPGLYSTQPHGEMRLSILMDNSNEILRDIIIDLSDLQDNEWSQVIFAPIMYSQGKTFRVVVSAQVQHGRVALYEISTQKTTIWTRLKLRIENLMNRYLSISTRQTSPALFPVYRDP